MSESIEMKSGIKADHIDIRGIVKKHKLAIFFILAFAITWIFRFIPMYAEASGVILPDWAGYFIYACMYGPTLAAIAMAAIEGRDALKQLVSRCLRWRVGIRWYAAAIFIPMLTMLAADLLFSLYSGKLPDFSTLLQNWYLLPVYLLVYILLGGAPAEEIGWRGYAQPMLQKMYGNRKYGILLTTIIIGLAWGLWYVPNFLIPGSESNVMFGPAFIPVFVLTEVGNAFVITWIFNHTNGSALVSGLLMHGSLNMWGMFLLQNSTGVDGTSVPIAPMVIVINCAIVLLVAAILTVATRGRLGAGHIDRVK